jgi:hypothetical protein
MVYNFAFIKKNNHLSLSSSNGTQKDPVNPGPGLRQVQKCGGAKLINGILTTHLVVGSSTTIQI